MTIRSHYLLDVDPGEPAFDRVEDALEDLGTACGMEFQLDEVESPDGVASHYVYLDHRGLARLILVDDTDTPMSYVIVEAHDETTASQVGRAVAQVLPVRSGGDLRQSAAEGMEDDPGHLMRMAAAAGSKADAETMSILERGLKSGSRDVRISAIEAASLTQWPEAEDLLISAREHDPDPELRGWAANALDALRAAQEG